MVLETLRETPAIWKFQKKGRKKIKEKEIKEKKEC
jgi:hypothetical protein